MRIPRVGITREREGDSPMIGAMLAAAIATAALAHGPDVEPKVKFYHGGFIEPPGPGHGWGFPDSAPDGYGWRDPAGLLPICSGRDPEYYFPRFLAVPPIQAFPPTYFNPYLTRGQRYIPYSCWPPFGTETPFNPYAASLSNDPKVPVPAFTGKVEAKPVTTNAGGGYGGGMSR